MQEMRAETPDAIEYASAPLSHLWIAACLGIGGALLVASLFLGLGEVLYSVKRLVLEAIFRAA